jgi:hypothetical protein
MSIGSSIVRFATRRPKTVTGLMLLTTLLLGALAALPSLWPNVFPMLSPVKVDTDPENMLPAHEGIRVFNDHMKSELLLHDMVVLGVVNETNPDGVFNPESLNRIYELTEYSKELRWDAPAGGDKKIGVVVQDIIAPSTVDNLEQGGPGVVKFERLMPTPPKTREEALAVRDKALRLPFLKGTMVSEDGKALCLYLPLTSKDQSYRVYSALREKIATYKGDDRFFITGLPVAEDTFGVEMFKQMAISAPIAMGIIFILMLIFFRRVLLVLSPMIVAMVSVISTMGLLIITGNTVHIMSSMIPIFIMPIAVLDAVHILSEFFDRYQESKDRRETIHRVMETLFMPMLYTSLTTAVGFASLSLTPIPPVQVFGLFIAFGVLIAWVWTVLFIPAFVMFIPERRLKNFGTRPTGEEEEHPSFMGRVLAKTGRFTFRHAWGIMGAVLVAVLIAGYGISKIRINDNPIKWFVPSHPIREADRVLNQHFGGTYMAYLALMPTDEESSPAAYAATLEDLLTKREAELSGTAGAKTVFNELIAKAKSLAATVKSRQELLDKLYEFANNRLTEDFERFDAWDQAALLVGEEQQKGDIFKQPEVLRYMEKVQAELLKTGVVGKSNSLGDIVKTVHRELMAERLIPRMMRLTSSAMGRRADQPEDPYRIPDTPGAVADCINQYQNSNRPQDVWHFVTPDFRTSSIWVQLNSGDNRDMSRVVQVMDRFFASDPPPMGLHHRWFGLTYINVVWQEKMVTGMLEAFLGSFLAVLVLMTLLYRSAVWGLICMVPLTVTIALIYGMIGLIGKDYDMPVAVLSSLSLGLAVDYAIHFLSRGRELRAKYGSWEKAAGPVFGEPALAISRNVIVIGVGFLPLLLAPLVPYRTVGLFIAAILIAAGAATLLILPAMIRILEPFLFPKTRPCCFTCQCATCIITAVAMVALVAVNMRQFFEVGWTKLSWFSLGALIVLVALCAVMSHREKCRIQKIVDEGEKK